MEDLIALHRRTQNSEAIQERIARTTNLKSKSQENLTSFGSHLQFYQIHNDDSNSLSAPEKSWFDKGIPNKVSATDTKDTDKPARISEKQNGRSLEPLFSKTAKNDPEPESDNLKYKAATRQNTSTTLLSYNTVTSSAPAGDQISASRKSRISPEQHPEFQMSSKLSLMAEKHSIGESKANSQLPSRENRDSKQNHTEKMSLNPVMKTSQPIPEGSSNSSHKSREALKELYSRYNLASKDGSFIKPAPHSKEKRIITLNANHNPIKEIQNQKLEANTGGVLQKEIENGKNKTSNKIACKIEAPPRQANISTKDDIQENLERKQPKNMNAVEEKLKLASISVRSTGEDENYVGENTEEFHLNLDSCMDKFEEEDYDFRGVVTRRSIQTPTEHGEQDSSVRAARTADSQRTIGTLTEREGGKSKANEADEILWVSPEINNWQPQNEDHPGIEKNYTRRHDMFGAELQVTENDDEEENLDEYLSQLDLNTSFNEYCLNDVMTRIESSHSSSLSSAASLWEDDDFAMEATDRVCEIFQSIEKLLYNGVRGRDIPDRIVTECGDWRLLFPQLRLEGLGRRRNPEFSEELSTSAMLANEGVIFTEPMVSSRKKLGQKSSKRDAVASKSSTIKSLSIDGSSSTLHPFPRLVRSFDDFSPSTIPLTHEQMVEQVFVQEGEMEELIAFDQQEPPHSTWSEQQEKFHVPRKKSGIPPVTPFPFRSDEIHRELFHATWKEVTSSLQKYMQQRIAGLTSAALRDLMVSPDSNPLMNKFLDSQPDIMAYQDQTSKKATERLKRMNVNVPSGTEGENKEEEIHEYDDLVGVESRPSTVQNDYILPRDTGTADTEDPRRSYADTYERTHADKPGDISVKQNSSSAEPLYKLDPTRNANSSSFQRRDIVINKTRKESTSINKTFSKLSPPRTQPTTSSTKRKSRIFSGIIGGQTQTQTTNKQQNTSLSNKNKQSLSSTIKETNNSKSTSLTRKSAIKHVSQTDQGPVDVKGKNNNITPPSTSNSQNSSNSTVVEGGRISQLVGKVDKERKPMVRYSDTAPAEAVRPTHKFGLSSLNKGGLPSKFENIQSSPLQGPLVGKATRIYSKQKAGVFKTPTSKTADETQTKLNKSNSSRRKNALYYV
ncbi:uncharacterized protein LOC134844327 isoform X2 [Symsagittifera roscoffensis]